MARCLSDTDTSSDNQSDCDEEILKLFDSDEEVDKSFSGFSTQVDESILYDDVEIGQNSARKTKMASQSKNAAEHESGKSKIKGKTPLKRPAPAPQASSQKRTEPPQEGEILEELASTSKVPTSPVKRKKQKTDTDSSKSKTKSKSTCKTQKKDKDPRSDNAELLTNLFRGLTESLTATLKSNVNKAPQGQAQKSRNRETVQSVETESEYENEENEINENFNIFTDEETENVEVSDNDFDYELPNIFDEERFGTEVSASLAKVFDNICKKKSDVSSMIKEIKIPINCKSLVVPPVNTEIWQFLERKAKSTDLNMQTIQRNLAYGIVPLIRVAELLKTRKPDVKEMRECISKSMALLSNTHFEISIRRRISLKPHIDRKYHQLCNKNENVGESLFGDDVGKRLKDINEINKINKNISSVHTNFRRGNYRGRQGGRFLGGRGASRYNSNYQRRYPQTQYITGRGRSVGGLRRKPNL